MWVTHEHSRFTVIVGGPDKPGHDGIDYEPQAAASAAASHSLNSGVSSRVSV
jgi:hypothetical protein